MQDCGVSSALAMEIPQSCTRLSAYTEASSLNEKLNIVNIIGMCLQGPNWQQINIDLDIGLALYWWHANVWTNADIAHSAWMSSDLSLYIMIHYIAVCLYVFHTMCMNVTLASDYIYICYSYLFPFKHWLLCIDYITFTCVYFLCIYWFIYWKSGTTDHFGANVTCLTMYWL